MPEVPNVWSVLNPEKSSSLTGLPTLSASVSHVERS